VANTSGGLAKKRGGLAKMYHLWRKAEICGENVKNAGEKKNSSGTTVFKDRPVPRRQRLIMQNDYAKFMQNDYAKFMQNVYAKFMHKTLHRPKASNAQTAPVCLPL
jgi:hypothetical protein